jgi:hypothetical protein
MIPSQNEDKSVPEVIDILSLLKGDPTLTKLCHVDSMPSGAIMSPPDEKKPAQPSSTSLKGMLSGTW